LFYVNMTSIIIIPPYIVKSPCSEKLSVMYEDLTIPHIRSWGC